MTSKTPKSKVKQVSFFGIIRSIWTFIKDLLKGIFKIIKVIYSFTIRALQQIFTFMKGIILLGLFSSITISIFIISLSLSFFLLIKASDITKSETLIQQRERFFQIIALQNEEELKKLEQKVLEEIKKDKEMDK
jgi:hypothetical protein